MTAGNPRKATPRKRAYGGEKQLQASITAAMKTLGWHYNHVYRLQTASGQWRTSTTAKGWVDLVALRPGWVVACEVKGLGGRVEDEQLACLALFAAVPGGRAWVLRPRDDPDDWRRWLRDPQHAPRRYGWDLDAAAAALARMDAKRARNARKTLPARDSQPRLL